MRDAMIWLGSFGLDFKLALRLLARYPLLTIVGGAAMAFGLAASVTGFEVRAQLTNPRLPLEAGDRIVGLRNWDIRRDRLGPVSAEDFSVWRERLQRVQDLSAVARTERNVTVNGTVEPLSVADITASGFRVARVRPLLGRTLLEADEAPGAPPVVVIGHSLWQRRFAGDPGVVGSTVRIGSEQTTIVGVMPEKFAFPAAHQVWIPLRRQTLSGARAATTLLVFGRLVDGVSRDEAQAELTAVGQRMAADAPETYEFLRPEVVPYAHLIIDPRSFPVGVALANIFLIMLVIVVCANVALLMFARASGREVEITVRNALGASRARIVAQMFTEAIALATLAAILGLFASRYGLRSFWRTLEADSGRALAFWVNDSLTPSTVAYSVGLTMLAAVIIGVLPALRATGRGLQARLQYSGRGGGYRFGGVWTAVIAVQVAVTVMFPAAAFFFHRWVVQGQTRDVGFAAEQYLSARLVMDETNAVEELRRRLTVEPGVTAVTFADSLPGMQHPGARFELDGGDAPSTYGHQPGLAFVDTDFFSVVGAQVMSGRGFTPTDVASGREVAIVNTSFVERVMGGRNPVGRRIRRLAQGDGETAGRPWVEIVGVVRDLGVSGSEGVGVYQPLVLDNTSVRLAVHVAGAPEALANRLRVLAADVDPTLRVYDVMPLDQVGADGWIESQYLSRLLTVLSAVALMLSLMAIYSVMAFTVVQRTREIGTRVALGADRWQIIASVVRKPLVQVGLGICVGGTLVMLLFAAMFQSAPTVIEAGLIAAYATLMLAVCLSACVAPTRRALRLQPSQVLRVDAS